MTVVSWNANGLTSDRLHALGCGDSSCAEYLAGIDVVGVWDTRNNKAWEDCSNSHIAHWHTTATNRPGSGGVILIARRAAARCFFQGFSNSVNLGWVLVQGRTGWFHNMCRTVRRVTLSRWQMLLATKMTIPFY